MSDKQTDNSFLKDKIILREEVINSIQDEIYLLDCYAGKGKIWSLIISRNPKRKINYIGIEKEKNKNKNLSVMEGDNIKYLQKLDLPLFNFIDLDAYGIPFEQIDIIMNSKFIGYICVTYIHTGMGRLPDNMLLKLGYSKEMIGKCPTLFSRNHKDKIKKILGIYGITSINLIEKGKKLYFYFKKDW